MRFRAAVPRPRAARSNLFRLLAILKDNPLEAWMSEHFEHPLVRDGLPFLPAVVVNDPAAVQRILLDNAANYRKDGLVLRILSPALSDGLLTTNGEQWRHQRRAVAPMFARQAIASYAPAMKRAADKLVRRWLGYSDGTVIDVAQELTDATIDVLQRTIFSQGLGHKNEALRTAMRLYFDTIGRIDPFDVLALPAFVPRWTKWRARPAIRFFDDTVRKIILERQRLISRSPGDCPRDILTLLLKARDPETGKDLSEKEIRANIITLIAAGHETTANAITWSLFLLSKDETWNECVAAEGRQALDEPELAAERLSATRAVVEEALRLYPPIAAISRVAIAADRLAGEIIGAGTMVIVAPYVIHRHRLLWERPDEFDPGRFFGENRQRIGRYAYLPFGAGPHICLGAQFALQEATILLATISAHFLLKRASDRDPEPLLRITLRPRGGLPMIVKRRPAQVCGHQVLQQQRAELPAVRLAS
jgi:cytochrome P450